MSSPTGPRDATPAAPITVRAYHQDDHGEVVNIFCDGMRGLAPVFIQHLMRNSKAQFALSSTSAILCAAIGRTAGPAIAVPVTVLAALLFLLGLHLLFRYGPMENYVLSSLMDDLADIPAAYKASRGSCFWIAEQAGNGTKPRILGCVGLQHKSADRAELRRMSVSRACRRAGVGRKLAEVLIQHARDMGFKEVVLETTSLQAPAIRLYQALGWEEVGSRAMAGGMVLIQKFVLRL